MANEVIKSMGVHHIAISVKDFEKSLAFYQKLGMKVAARWSDNGKEGSLLDVGDGVHIEIFSRGRDYCCDGKWAHIALTADDVDLAHKTALEAGAENHAFPKDAVMRTVPPVPLRIAFVRGPDGELIEFYKKM